MSFSFSAAEHVGLGFACNMENSVYSPVTCKLCNLIVFINVETVHVVAYCWLVQLIFSAMDINFPKIH